MPHAPTMRVAFTFSDRDGNTGDLHLYLPFSTTETEAFACAEAMLPYLHAISNAVVTRITLQYTATIESSTTPAAQSDIHRKLLLFVGNGENIEALTILSPDLDLFETTGPYAGIRVDMQSSLIAAFTNSYSTWAIPFCTEDGDVIGPTLIMGGLSL
jgi:hypothetical protein